MQLERQKEHINTIKVYYTEEFSKMSHFHERIRTRQRSSDSQQGEKVNTVILLFERLKRDRGTHEKIMGVGGDTHCMSIKQWLASSLKEIK